MMKTDVSSSGTFVSQAQRRFTNVADDENAFIYAMGFAVEPGANPLKMGLKRVAWLERERRAARFDTRKDPQHRRFDYKARRLTAVREFVDACKPGGTECANAFISGDRVFDQWLTSEGWLLDRYRALIALPGWWESVSFDARAPLPPYALVMDGQRLLLLNAKVMVARGDSVGASRLLEDDLRFWRMVLASSDIPISKMIATAAINRHFELGSSIFRELESGQVMSTVPANWSIAISESERSMRRCLVGEWMYMSATLCNADVDRYVLKDEHSLVACARVNGLEPYAYLHHLFEELPKASNAEALEALLPWNIKSLLSRTRQ
jgi:IS66 C-terminal element